MSDNFQAIIRGLWSSLGMGAPVFTAEDLIILSVDGVDLTLTESDDGRHVDVTGRAGRLSADSFERGRQVSQILEISLANLTSNRACVCLETGTEERRDILVQARHPYAPMRLARLTSTIEDVLQTVEYWRATLRPDRPAAPARQRTSDQVELEQAMIFRP